MLLRSALPDGAVEPVWLGLALTLVVIGTLGARRLHVQGHLLAAAGVLASLSVAVSPISWVHHLVWLAFPFAALAAADRWRIVLGWYVVLLPGLPAIASSAAEAEALPAALAQVLIDLQGLTALAAVLFLPRLIQRRTATGIDEPLRRRESKV
jgi:alpha-1,2-mannosyltransferase